MSGACPGRMPRYPSCPGSSTWSVSVSTTFFSGVTTTSLSAIIPPGSVHRSIGSSVHLPLFEPQSSDDSMTRCTDSSKSALDQAAVHLDGRAGDVARALAREKGDDFADLS